MAPDAPASTAILLPPSVAAATPPPIAVDVAAPERPATPAALVLLASLAVIGSLHWAQPFVVPLTLGIVISFMLNPLVKWLARRHVPRAAGAAVVVVMLVAGLTIGGWGLSGQAEGLLYNLPEAARKIARNLRHLQEDGSGVLTQIQRAARELNAVTAPDASPATPPAAVAPKVDVFEETKSFLWGQSATLLGTASKLLMVIFLVYFLLTSGEALKRKLVQVVPSLENKRITVKILDDCGDQIQRYMQVILITNAVLGVMIWLLLAWMGLDYAAVWGLFAFFVHTIPYVGSALIAGGSAFAALVQFGSLGQALTVSVAALVASTLVGMLLQTWLQSRSSRMNAVTVFVGLLFWGWLWGLWGMLLGIPIVAIIKSVCDHVESLQPLGVMMGD